MLLLVLLLQSCTGNYSIIGSTIGGIIGSIFENDKHRNNHMYYNDNTPSTAGIIIGHEIEQKIKQ